MLFSHYRALLTHSSAMILETDADFVIQDVRGCGIIVFKKS